MLVVVLAASGGGERTYHVPSAGMEATIRCARPDPGCRVKRRTSSSSRRRERKDSRRGDIVVFELSAAEARACAATTADKLVKRVVGLPGKRVTIRSGGRKINGRLLAEPCTATSQPHPVYGKWVIPPSFLVGDNRAFSCDSRADGPIAAEAIVGKVVAIERGSERIDVD